MVLDSLAAGLDPAHSVFYLQSAIPEVAETVAGMRRAMGLTAVFSQLRDEARRTSGADGI
jgi:tryptophanyl-tRNA synthetase